MDAGDIAALLASLLAPRLLTLARGFRAPGPVARAGSPPCGRPLPDVPGTRLRPRDGGLLGCCCGWCCCDCCRCCCCCCCTGSVGLRWGAAKTAGMGDTSGFSDVGEVGMEDDISVGVDCSRACPDFNAWRRRYLKKKKMIARMSKIPAVSRVSVRYGTKGYFERGSVTYNAHGNAGLLPWRTTIVRIRATGRAGAGRRWVRSRPCLCCGQCRRGRIGPARFRRRILNVPEIRRRHRSVLDEGRFGRSRLLRRGVRLARLIALASAALRRVGMRRSGSLSGGLCGFRLR